MDIYNTNAAVGPPSRKGDSTHSPKGLVEAMKVGLRAHYTKKGEPHQLTEGNGAISEAYDVDHINRRSREVAPSVMKDALKTGLRAWYTKHGGLQESTTAVNVGARLPERALGSWKDGRPSRRTIRPMEKGGTSLRDDIQRLEKALEGTLATLSNKHRLSEKEFESFGNLLLDALLDMMRGSSDKMHDVKAKATLIESSAFIGEAPQETATILTNDNDLGTIFSRKMGRAFTGSIVEMVSGQLSSGMSLNTIRHNVAAALQNPNTTRVRETLSRAARVLSEL